MKWITGLLIVSNLLNKLNKKRKFRKFIPHLKNSNSSFILKILVVAGTNKLERSSHDFYFLMPDVESSEVFFKRIEKAIDGTDKFMYKQNIFGFPERLIIPKGRRGGQVYQLFVYVSPVSESVTYKSRIFGDYEFSMKPMGFPLDRPITHYSWFQENNMFFKDVTIYFKSDVDPNATV